MCSSARELAVPEGCHCRLTRRRSTHVHCTAAPAAEAGRRAVHCAFCSVRVPLLPAVLPWRRRGAGHHCAPQAPWPADALAYCCAVLRDGSRSLPATPVQGRDGHGGTDAPWARRAREHRLRARPVREPLRRRCAAPPEIPHHGPAVRLPQPHDVRAASLSRNLLDSDQCVVLDSSNVAAGGHEALPPSLSLSLSLSLSFSRSLAPSLPPSPPPLSRGAGTRCATKGRRSASTRWPSPRSTPSRCGCTAGCRRRAPLQRLHRSPMMR